MRRRTFLRLAGLAAAIGLPSTSSAYYRPIVHGGPTVTPAAVGRNCLHEHDRLGLSTVIKVISIDGSGAKAVEQMISSGVSGIEFICCHTDPIVLNESSATTKIHLGQGLGAINPHAIANRLTPAEHLRIAEALAGAHMVFVIAGSEGGATPVVAEIAHRMNILTVAVVTTPWTFGQLVLEDDSAALLPYVNMLLYTSNAMIGEALDHEITADLTNILRAIGADKSQAVKSIADIINRPGLVGVDFEDVRTVLGNGGVAKMGTAVASGPGRALAAAEGAAAKLVHDTHDALSDASGVLINISAGSSISLKEFKTVTAVLKKYIPETATVICSAPFDEAMEDHLRVTVIATGQLRRKCVAKGGPERGIGFTA